MFSSIGIAKSSHFCMGMEMMSEFGLAIKHLDCGMASQNPHESSDAHQSIIPDDCCQNQFELVHNDTDQTVKVLKVDAAQLIFIAAFTQSFIFEITPFIVTEQPKPYLTPPLIEKDFSILFQSFLI